MLTFLRKIRKSLVASSPAIALAKESGSGRKYLLYAIGEIALVVIGILIALQINNWNENRKENDKEITYLSNLNNELHNNIGLAKDYQDYSIRQINATTYLSNSMTSTNLDLNVVDWIDALIICFNLPHPHYNKNVWQELKSTGDLSIIKDKTLTNRISEYYNYIDQTDDVEKEFIPTHLNYRKITNEILDFNLKKKLVDDRLNKGILSFSKLIEAEGLITTSELDSLISELRKIEGLSGLLSDIYLNRKVTEIKHKDIENKSIGLITIIENKIMESK